MNEELLKKAKEAVSVEELLKLAEENKIELSKEEAEKIFTRLHCNGELTEDDLDKVSGGGCSEYVFSGPKYAIGHYVELKGDSWYRYCYDCKYNCWIVKNIDYEYRSRVYILSCANCGRKKTAEESDIKGYCTNI